MGLVNYKKGLREVPYPPPPPTMCGYKTAICEPESLSFPHMECACVLILDSPASRTVRDKCCVSHLASGIPGSPEGTKTPPLVLTLSQDPMCLLLYIGLVWL